MNLKEELTQLLAQNGIIDIEVVPNNDDEKGYMLPILLANRSSNLDAGVMVVVTDVVYDYDFRWPEQCQKVILSIAQAIVESHNNLVAKVNEIAKQGRDEVRKLKSPTSL